MRIRTVWDWRLRIYPLIVIPLIVILGSPTRHDKWPLEPTQGEAVIYHPAPEREGEIAARESLEPEGPTVGKAKLSNAGFVGNAQNGLTGRRDAHFSAIHGFHKGRAITCVRHPKITHCVEWKHPNTLIDR